MFRHNFSIFLRHIWQNKVSLSLSFLGLTVAFAFIFVIGIISRDALTSDQWLDTSTRLHRLLQSNQADRWDVSVYGPFAPLVRDNFAEVDAVTRLYFQPIKGAKKASDDFFSRDVTFVDPNFADLFPLPTLNGDLESTLANPRGLVLAASEAEQLFGTTDAVGQILTLEFNNRRYDYEVGAVLRALPDATHLDFNMILPMNIEDFEGTRVYDEATGYGMTGRISLYMLLRENTDLDAMNEGLLERMRALVPEASFSDENLMIEPVRGLQFWTRSEASQMVSPIDRQALISLIVAAILVLVAALSNHMNLTIAAMMRRGREVAIRRILGASKRRVAVQLFLETLVLTSLAAWLSIDLAPFIADYVVGFVGQSNGINTAGRLFEIASILTLSVAAAVIVALYPIIWLTRSQVRTLLSGAQASVVGGGSQLRFALISLQVALGVGLTFATFSINGQIRHLLTIDKGFEYENKIHIDAAQGAIWNERRESFAAEIATIGGVDNITLSTNIPFINAHWRFGFTNPRTSEPVELEGLIAEPEFFENFGIQAVAGRVLSDEFSRDKIDREKELASARTRQQDNPLIEKNVVISEDAVALLGFASNEAALGQPLRTRRGRTSDGQEYQYRETIVGVVPAVNFKTGSALSVPTFYATNDRNPQYSYGYLTVTYNGSDKPAAIQAINAVWDRMFPEDNFDYSLSEENLENGYRAENSLFNLFAIAGVLSIMITLTGIYSLARFLLAQRTKEVALRRVMGAGTRDIIRLLVSDFGRPVLLGIAVGLPVSVLFVEKWLDNYTVRMDGTLETGLFFAAFSLVFCLGIVIVEALRATKKRPALVLYHE